MQHSVRAGVLDQLRPGVHDYVREALRDRDRAGMRHRHVRRAEVLGRTEGKVLGGAEAGVQTSA